jgi:hypothetical protein
VRSPSEVVADTDIEALIPLRVSIDTEIGETIVYARVVVYVISDEAVDAREHQFTADVAAASSPGRAKGDHLAGVVAAHVLDDAAPFDIL